MKSKRVTVTIGYTKGGLHPPNYKWWRRQNLEGVDLQVIDGLGNEIQVNARKGGIGYHIEVNGKTIATGGVGA